MGSRLLFREQRNFLAGETVAGAENPSSFQAIYAQLVMGAVHAAPGTETALALAAGRWVRRFAKLRKGRCESHDAAHKFEPTDAHTLRVIGTFELTRHFDECSALQASAKRFGCFDS